MCVIGYIRVSSQKQTCQHQKYEIEQFARHNKCHIDKWVQETISSRQPLHKRALGQVLNNTSTGDIIIACEISRLGRSLLEIMRILEDCLHKNCQIWTIKENYRLGNDIQSKIMAFAFGLAAEIERNLISQRTKSSLDNLRASGKKLGRPFAASTQRLKLNQNTKMIRKMIKRGEAKREIARQMHVDPSTLRRFLKHTDY